jgi:hypothetical protein
MVIATVNGKDYLVSMLGPDSDWVKNVEAAHGDAVIRQGRRRSVRAVSRPHCAAGISAVTEFVVKFFPARAAFSVLLEWRYSSRQISTVRQPPDPDRSSIVS